MNEFKYFGSYCSSYEIIVAKQLSFTVDLERPALQENIAVQFTSSTNTV